MTKTPFEDELHQLFAELAASEHVEAPVFVANEVGPRDERHHRRWVPVLASVAAVLGLVGGLVVVSRTDRTIVETDPGGTSTAPVGGPVVLTAGVDGPDVTTSDARPLLLFGEPRGTVASPDGTVFGLGLAQRTDETIPGERRSLAGFEVTILTDGSAPTQIYRTVDLECTSLTVTTAGSPAMTAEFTTLLESITQDGSTVTLDLPVDWKSYGAAVGPNHYTSRLRLESGSQSGAEIDLQQAPGAPIGYWLGGGETAPVLLSDDGTDQLWWVAGATTPGLNRLIGTRYGTLFVLGGRVPVEELRVIADNLAPIGSSLAIETNNLAPPGDEAMAAESDRAAVAGPGCNRGSIALAVATPGDSSQETAPSVSRPAEVPLTEPDGVPQADSAVSEDLLAYLFPVDGHDYRAGAESIESILFGDYHDRMGACLTEAGYQTIGSLMAVARQTETVDVWRFPDLNRLELSGFLPPLSDPILNLMGHVEPGERVTSTGALMVQELQQHPEYGLDGTVEEADALNQAISICISQVQLSADVELALSIRLDWFFEVDSIDTRSELRATIRATGECLAEAGVLTEALSGPDEIRGGVDGYITGLVLQRQPGLEQLAVGGRGYGRCLSDLDQARKPLREAVRVERIGELESSLTRLGAALP